MHVSTSPRPLRLRTRCGYLLLEVILALSVAVLVLAGVFSLAAGALALSEEIAEDGREQIAEETFLTFLERSLEALPGNAIINLESQDRGSHYVSDLTFEDVPVSFSWAGQALSAEAIQLSTVLRRDNTLDIVLRYYDQKILGQTAESEALQIDPVAELTLLRNVWRFEWRVLDGRTMEWDYAWDLNGRQPLQLELNVVFHPEGEEVIHYFWIPPKINPETVIRNQRRPAQGLPGQRGDGEEGPDNPDRPDRPDRPTIRPNPQPGPIVE